MDYLRIYKELIERGQIREPDPDVYYESHHIVPYCITKDNSKENLVKLTAREHFIAHWILFRIYPENSGISYAFWMMCNIKISGRSYNVSSRTYEEARIIHSKNVSEFMTVKWSGEDERLKMSEISKKMWEDPKTKSDIKKRMIEAWEDPVLKEKVSNSHKIRWSDHSLRKDHSDKIKEKHANPEFKKMFSDKMNEVCSSTEYKDSLSRGQKERWKNPDERRKICKYSDSEIREIRKMIDDGERPKDIQEKFNLCPPTYYSIKSKKSYWWVE